MKNNIQLIQNRILFMETTINNAWETVNKSLAEIWKPIADSIGIPYVGCTDYNSNKMLYAQCKHFDDNLWSGLTAILKESIGSIATVSQGDTYFKIDFPDIRQDLFMVCFHLWTCEDTAMDTVEPEEVNGKLRLEVIDYLTKKEVIPSFQYVLVEIHAGEIWEHRVIGRDCTNKDIYKYIGAIIDGVLKTPIIYSLLKSTQNKIIERYRLIEERKLAQEQEDKCLAKAFANVVKPHIENAGWKDRWRVYKEYCHFVLELQLTCSDVIRYCSPDQDDIISLIPAIVNFVNKYKILHNGQGQLSVLKDWNTIII